MPQVLVNVSSTVGSTIHEEATGSAAPLEVKSGHGREGWPVGWGHVDQALSGDGRELEALVLMREPSLPGMDVRARPVAVLHLGGDGPSDELLCVAEDDCFRSLADVSDLPRWHADPDIWVVVLDRLVPGQGHRVQGCSSTAEAERLVDEMYRAYLRSTGGVD